MSNAMPHSLFIPQKTKDNYNCKHELSQISQILVSSSPLEQQCMQVVVKHRASPFVWPVCTVGLSAWQVANISLHPSLMAKRSEAIIQRKTGGWQNRVLLLKLSAPASQSENILLGGHTVDEYGFAHVPPSMLGQGPHPWKNWRTEISSLPIKFLKAKEKKKTSKGEKKSKV